MFTKNDKLLEICNIKFWLKHVSEIVHINIQSIQMFVDCFMHSCTMMNNVFWFLFVVEKFYGWMRYFCKKTFVVHLHPSVKLLRYAQVSLKFVQGYLQQFRNC